MFETTLLLLINIFAGDSQLSSNTTAPFGVLPLVTLVDLTLVANACVRSLPKDHWYTNIVQGFTNGTIGNTICTNGNANGTIGSPNGTIGKLKLPLATNGTIGKIITIGRTPNRAIDSHWYQW